MVLELIRRVRDKGLPSSSSATTCPTCSRLPTASTSPAWASVRRWSTPKDQHERHRGRDDGAWPRAPPNCLKRLLMLKNIDPQPQTC